MQFQVSATRIDARVEYIQRRPRACAPLPTDKTAEMTHTHTGAFLGYASTAAVRARPRRS